MPTTHPLQPQHQPHHGNAADHNILVFNRHRRNWRSGPMESPDKFSMTAELLGIAVFCVILLAIVILLKTQLNP